MLLSGVKAYNTPLGQSSVYLAKTQSQVSPQGMNFTITTFNNSILNIMSVKGEQLSGAAVTVLPHTDLVSAWPWIVLVGE